VGRKWYRTEVLVVTIAAMLQACNESSSQPSNGAELVGSWVTEQCYPLTAVGTNGYAVSNWTKGEYRFTMDNRITWRFFAYDNASCLGDASLIGTSQNVAEVLYYEDLGKETLQEGLLGHRLHVQLKEGDAVKLESTNVFAVVLDANRLCTSDYLRLSGNSIGVADVRGTQINFDECLVLGQLP
jgi:hypothetical protein